MQGDKLLSVIVPMFNVEKYVEKCLKSISDQTYANLEIIVINDGSTDNSRKIAEICRKNDDRIKIYDFENAGLSEARNRGLKLAKGDYIAFVDSDDWLANDMYSILIKKAIQYDLDIIKCSAYESENGVNKKLLPKQETLKYNCDVGGNREVC